MANAYNYTLIVKDMNYFLKIPCLFLKLFSLLSASTMKQSSGFPGHMCSELIYSNREMMSSKEEMVIFFGRDMLWCV